MKKVLIGVALVASTCAVHAQTWDDTGNLAVIPGFNFLGSLNNAQLDVITNNVRRFTLLPDATYAIGGFPAQVKNGSLLLSPNVDGFYAGGAPGPFTGLHLAAATNNTQQAGYRSNMGNGITLTGNNDQMYVGQLFRSLDFTDAAIVWSDNPGEWLADRLTFNFTSSYNAGASIGNSSFRGLQTMLIQPASNGQEAFVGVGDFDAVSATPNARLDVLDGKVRIRELPTSPAASTLTQFLVTDANGVIHWRNVPTAPGGPGCEWTLVGTGNANVATAYASNPGCPQADKRVGIGTNNPLYKLDVIHSSANGGGIGGQRVQFTGPSTGWAKGIDAFVLPLPGSSLQQVTGVHGEISGVDLSGSGVSGKATAGALDGLATSVSGVSGLAYGPTNGSTVTNIHGLAGESIGQANGNVSNSFGVYGKSSGSNIQKSFGSYGYGLGGTQETYGGYFWGNGPSGSTTYGVYGRATGGTTNWSGFFAGNVQIQGNLFNGTTLIFSDAALKTEVDQIGPVGQQLAALRPKRYRYSDAAQERMNLSDGVQFGFIAQEVQEVLPELVSSTTLPAVLDSLGNEVSPEMAVNAVNYNSIIPLLVAGYQEQMSTLNELRDRLSELEHQLAACCANPDGVRSLPQGNTEPTGLGNDLTGTDKLRIQPNPFNERTTVYYTVDRGGRTQLLANSSDGRELRVLQEANLEAGSYQFEWDTASLAPGLYYVTLLLDGQPVVKKAVKVDR